MPASSTTVMTAPQVSGDLSDALIQWVRSAYGSMGGAFYENGTKIQIAFNDGSQSGFIGETLDAATNDITNHTVEGFERFFATISRFEPATPTHWLNTYIEPAYTAFVIWRQNRSMANMRTFADKYDRLVRAMLYAQPRSEAYRPRFWKSPIFLIGAAISAIGVGYALYSRKRVGTHGLGRARRRRKRR